MPTQTAASRGYVLFRGAIRDTHKSPTNCLPECGHDPWSAPNLERHGSSKMQPFGWLEMPYFLNRIFHLYFHMKSPSVFLIILLIKAKHGRELFVCINVILLTNSLSYAILNLHRSLQRHFFIPLFCYFFHIAYIRRTPRGRCPFLTLILWGYIYGNFPVS